MNKITTSVYENLTPKQRVVASIEAESRGDAAERKRLIQTCPKVTYRQTDAKFSETMDRLLAAAAGIECELRGHALSFLFAMLNDPKNAHTFLQAGGIAPRKWPTHWDTYIPITGGPTNGWQTRETGRHCTEASPS